MIFEHENPNTKIVPLSVENVSRKVLIKQRLDHSSTLLFETRNTKMYCIRVFQQAFKIPFEMHFYNTRIFRWFK